MKRKYRVEVYSSLRRFNPVQNWFGRVVSASNGNILCDFSEGYQRKGALLRTIRKVCNPETVDLDNIIIAP